jgi:mRNA-degrading endonuclease HigB of HigAB toxin-antitoxin module
MKLKEAFTELRRYSWQQPASLKDTAPNSVSNEPAPTGDMQGNT